MAACRVFVVCRLAKRKIRVPALFISSDPVVSTSTYEAATAAFGVPARTTSVFIQKRAVAEQLDLLIADVDQLEAEGILNLGQANALRVKLQNAQASLASGKANAAANQLKAFRNQVRAFAQGGVLTGEQAQLLDQAAAAALSGL